MKPTRLLIILLLLSNNLWADGFIRVDKSDGTFFKATTGQASSLPAAQKCELGRDDIMQFSSIAAENNHFLISLPRAYPGCGLTTGYLYQPHVSTDSTTLTVFTHTIFKKTTAQSSTLPPAQKCSLAKGFYKTSNNPSVTNGHYQVNFAQVPSGCGFSSGYITTVHAINNIQGMTLRSSAWLKTSTANSSTLPSSDKCLIGANDYLLSDAVDSQDNHYQVNLASTPSGCGFSSGFVYYFNSTLPEPQSTEPPVTNYTWPEPGSSLGSGWCVCRNIGTSPHIGQDFVKYGAKSAVAIQSGSITSSTFSSSCGHIVLLEDDFGSIWRYVHLNQPLFGVGSRVQNGQKLADISAYPRSGCGSGPHLHFERRSSGAFNDSATGKSCQNGYRTCYYDPIKPFRNRSAELASLFPDVNRVALPTAVKPPQSAGICKVDTSTYPIELETRLATYETASNRMLTWQLDALTTASKESLIETTVELINNPSNQCTSSSGADCAISWSVLSEQKDGQWRRLFYDASIRNQPLSRVFEEAYCLPEQASGRFILLLENANGDRLKMLKNIELK